MEERRCVFISRIDGDIIECTERRLSVGVLNSHLLCVLCSGYLIDATAIVECLHRFCKSCIVNYLKSNSFCPICDVQINQGKLWDSLRPDKTIQSLVYKLVPGLYQTEMARRRTFYRENPGEVPEGEAGGQIPLGERFYSQEDSISLSLEYYSDSFEDCDDDEDSDWAEDTVSIPIKRYLQCPAAVAVRHLKKFLRLKFFIGSDNQIDIIYKDECLPDTFSLMDVAYTFHWNRKSPMRFAYRVFKKMVKKSPQDDQENLQLSIDSVSPKTSVDHQHRQQRQSEYLGHLNLNPTPGQTKTNGPLEQAETRSRDEESDSANSELRIVSEKETAAEPSSSEEEYHPKIVRKHGKKRRHDLTKKSPERRRKSDSSADHLRRKMLADKKKRRKSMIETAERSSNEDENLKNEALKKVFVYKEKPERKDGDLRRKKRKKSKHHEGEAKKRKSEMIVSPSILSVAKDALKLKVKLGPPKITENSNDIKGGDSKANKERLLHLRAVRHKNIVSKKDYISTPPSLTISKVGANEQVGCKTSLVESKPSLEIMLVKKSEECNGNEPFGVLDLSDKSTRPKEATSPAEKTPKKSTQQSILQIAETLVRQKSNVDVKPSDQSVAVVAMRDLKTLSDAAVNILMAAQSQTQSSPKRPENCSSPIKIPVYHRERTNPIPPVPNLHEIYPRGRGKPIGIPPRLPPLIKPGQNQNVRQIPDPSLVLNRQNNMLNHVQNRPDSSTSPEKSKLESIPPLQSIKKLTPPLSIQEKKDVVKSINNNIKIVQNTGSVPKVQSPVSSSSPLKIAAPSPISSIRRVEHMARNIESVAAGLTARAAAMIDAK